MGDNLKVLYKILAALEKAMDCPEFDFSGVRAEDLNISEERWARSIAALEEAGYIAGVKVYRNVLGETKITPDNPRITVSGMEYLHDNSTAQKIIKAAQGISDFFT